MKAPQFPKNEDKRVQSLCSLNILDTPAEERFDRITRRAKQHFGVDIALVSLVDAKRQWFKSKQGLDASETPRDISFCGHAILSSSIFNIPDALEDPRFADNPLVTDPPHIRFYAGAPLRAADGQRIGTLCIIDNKPHNLSAEELSVLRELADEVEKELNPQRSSGMKFTLVQKFSLSSVLLVLLSAGVVGGIFYNKTTSLLVEDTLADVSREVQDAGDGLKAIIRTQDEDVLFLANTPPIQGILRAQSGDGYDNQGKTDTAVWKQRLQTIFKSQLLRKSSYLSIRYIDVAGQELVVVSRKGQEVVSLSDQQLQNKARRAYVSETLKLPGGSVYVSEIDLNREFGKVTEPRQEVIRSATPVYDESNNRLAGVVSITAEVEGKLHAIQSRVRQSHSSEIYITNDRGDYLIHPDSNKTYGFEYDEKHTIQKDFPRLAHLLDSDNQDKQMSYRTNDNHARQIVNFTKIFFDTNNPKRFIAIVITHGYSSIVAEQSKLLNDVVLWTLLLIIPGAGLGILLSINMARPIKQITQAMEDYSHQRKIQYKMPVNLNNEIGMMARSYQSLIGQVEEAHTVLEDMNRQLEKRVTERTKALETSEVRQRSIVENIIDGLITIDHKGTIESFNPAAEKIFGYAADEVIDHNVKMLMPAPYTREHDGYLFNYLSTGKKKIIGIGREVTGKRKDGSTFPMELSVSEMKINKERMFSGIVRDITERKRQESDIETRENRIRAIVETVVDGIVTIDKDGLVQTFNPAAEQIFGYQAEHVIGQNVKILMPTSYAQEHDGYLHNYLTTGEKKVIGIGREVTGRRKDGSTFPMDLSVSEMEIDGERMFTGIVRDITERKKVERMKSEFISTVSHELRTPLTSIRGALGLVLGKVSDLLPAKLLNMLEMANRNSERLTLLINDILDLEKIESGRLEFDFKSIDLVALAHQALADNEGYAVQHQVNLVLETELTEALVVGDDHRLLQVFANLISNAVKYSPTDGSVEISVRSHKNRYCIAVRDHGAGIPEEFRSSIFQRFAQADSSDTREKGGTGLGLSISKAIVERHEGHINYKSEQGKGTEFYFDLPHAQPVIRESRELINGRSAQVLICEDNADVAEILAEMLQEENLLSDIAATAEAARTLIAKNTYALMLLDLNLPDMDGLQFLKELRAKPATMELPIIVISGRATEGRENFTGDAVMVVDWIQKPVDREQLERAMTEALRRKVRPHILHIEDDLDIVQVTSTLLDDIADITQVATVKGSRELLDKEDFDLVILDLGLEDGSGLELLDELKGRCPIVIFSAQNPDREISAQVTAALTKSITSNEQLLATIKDALKGTIK